MEKSFRTSFLGLPEEKQKNLIFEKKIIKKSGFLAGFFYFQSLIPRYSAFLGFAYFSLGILGMMSAVHWMSGWVFKSFFCFFRIFSYSLQLYDTVKYLQLFRRLLYALYEFQISFYEILPSDFFRTFHYSRQKSLH